MKILWVKANKLLPLHSGGDIRSFHILKYLSKHHDVTFLSYYDGDRDARYEQELKDYFPNAISLCTGKSGPNIISRSLDYIRRLPEAAPYAVSRFASSEVKKQIETLLGSGSFDVAVCDFLDAAVNFPDPIQVPTVLFQHNVESEIWRRHAENESHPAKRIVYQMEFKKMLRYEQAEIRKFQQVIAVSENDRGLMESWATSVPIGIVPTGVDVLHYSAKVEAEAMDPTVMFIGAMDWEPNIDAAEYFCEHIWETVVKEISEAKFLIVGRKPGSTDKEPYFQVRRGDRRSSLGSGLSEESLGGGRSSAHWWWDALKNLRSYGRGQSCRFHYHRRRRS